MSSSKQLTGQHDLPSGLIYPPPEIRVIIENTAQFVFRNGLESEERIMAQTANNANLKFLCKSDTYHAYYQLKLTEYKGEPSVSDEKLRPDFPDCHMYSVTHREGITALELDIMMLVAQFSALYGPSFLWKNKIYHSMSKMIVDTASFAQLLAAYMEVVNPSKGPKRFKEELRDSAADMTTVLERCFHRLQWERFLHKERQEIEDARAQEVAETAQRFGITFPSPPPMQLPVPLPHGSEFAHPPPPKRPKLNESALDKMMMMSSSLIEQTRSKHAEIERLERLVMKELEFEQLSSRGRSFHRLFCMIQSIMLYTERLVESFDDTIKGIEDEIAVLPGHTATSLFRVRLDKIYEYHRDRSSGGLLVRPFDSTEDYEVLPGEECSSPYLDLHDMYNQYINSEFGERVEYSAYLDVFSQPEKTPRLLKLSSQYKRYMEGLLKCLVDFFQQTEPLQDLDIILSKVETDFEVIPSQHTPLEKLDFEKSTQSAKEVALMEAKVKKLCNLLDEQIKRTKQKEEEDMEEEAHSENPPVGWDGKPIPYLIYKLDNLGQELKCDICGGIYSYLERRDFERHFPHQHRMSLRRNIKH